MLHNLCFLFLNWQQGVNVSHDCHVCHKNVSWSVIVSDYIEWLNRYILTKIISMDNGQLELCPRFVRIWGLSCQGSNNKNLLSMHAIYRMLIIDRYSYLYSYSSTSTRTRTRTHVIIKYSDSDSDSHILQVLVLVLVLVNLVLAPALVTVKSHNLGLASYRLTPLLFHVNLGIPFLS